MSTRPLRILATAVLIVAALASCAETGPREPSPTATPTGDGVPVTRVEGATRAELLARGDADDPLALGDLDAPVTIVEWTDFSCPYCAAVAVDTLPDIVAEYVDTGLVRFEMHDMAKLGEGSMQAAIAARAAGEQDRYFAYLHALYAASPRDGHPAFTADGLLGFARDAGVPDLAAFRDRLGAADLRAAVAESQESAYAAGVEKVPTFVIGDTVLLGAQPIDVFRDAIDAELDAAGAP